MRSKELTKEIELETCKKLDSLYELRNSLYRQNEILRSRMYEKEIDAIKENYKNQYTKFKKNDIVVFKEHKKKKRYIVTKVNVTFFNIGDESHLTIGCELTTINHKPLSHVPWTYGQNQLELYNNK